MNKKQKVVLGIGAAVIILYMLRTKLASALTSTPLGALSDKLFNFISKFEGFTPVAKWDVHQYSVGYGSGFNWDLNRPVQLGDVVNQDTAKRWLLLEAQKDVDKVKALVKIPINDNQLIALASFCYNLGAGALQGSNLLKLLNSGANINTVAAEFDKWRLVNGKPSVPIAQRRALEKKLFLS